MGRIFAAGLVLLTLGACTGRGAAALVKPKSAPPAEATMAALMPYYGSYRLDPSSFIVIARLGWFFDSRDSAYRTLYAGSAANRFTIGPGFRVPLPTFTEIVFSGDRLTLKSGSETVAGSRIPYRQTDVTIPAQGAVLAGTITEALGAPPHPGIVIVHGSEPGQRWFYDFWVGVYTSLGLTVLTYDKRGQGSSTGSYPGEYPTEQALDVYADDATAALRVLAAWPGVDGSRVGFHGGSQGGWTVPLAIARRAPAAFAVLASAPATTVGQTDLWSGFSSGGTVAPQETPAQMDAAVRAEHSGYDPAAALASLRVPTLWLLGTNDRTVPTAICEEILKALNKPNLTVQMLPTGHALLVNRTGLLADDDRSAGLAPALLPGLKGWLSKTTA